MLAHGPRQVGSQVMHDVIPIRERMTPRLKQGTKALLLFGAAVAMPGCGLEVPIDSVRASGGSIELGPARLGKDGCWRFLVEPKPEFMHSAQYIGAYDSRVQGQAIQITARMYPVSRFRKTEEARVAIVCDVKDGHYQVLYRDPDGALHDLGEVHVDRGTELGGSAVRRYNSALNLTVTPLACARVAPAG